MKGKMTFTGRKLVYRASLGFKGKLWATTSKNLRLSSRKLPSYFQVLLQLKNRVS